MVETTVLLCSQNVTLETNLKIYNENQDVYDRRENLKNTLILFSPLISVKRPRTTNQISLKTRKNLNDISNKIFIMKEECKL